MSYDAIVIGAGMSGLAAGIRLAMFDKKVIVLEKHSIPGGLNSYYQRRNTQKGGIRQFDVGLHALTNFIKKGEKGKPFSKLLKQLRLSYDDFKLCPQTHSRILFPERELRFSNDFELLLNEVHEKFPKQVDHFCRLVEEVKAFNDVDLKQEYRSSRSVLKNIISDDLLIEMLISPLLIYGSAWEDDMDFAQFVIMFKSIYFEGFSRPEGGVRTIISLLMKRLEEVGGEIRFKAAVNEIITHDDKVKGVRVGEEVIEAPIIFSSIGYPETAKITQTLASKASPRVGAMTFLESIFIFDQKIPFENNDSTITFYNSSSTYAYRKPAELFDPGSAVVCFPDNYHRNDLSSEGVARVTFMANYQLWKNLDSTSYENKKELVAEKALELVRKLTQGFSGSVLFKDVFSPLTIERYTWHLNGTVYGSIDKTRDGTTPVDGLFIIGTDQGFLGIVGAILSGVSLANLYGLMGRE